MKTNFVLLAIGLVFAIVACTPKPENATPKPAVTSEPGIDADTITQAQFEQWTSAWDSLGVNYSDTALVAYYTMPVVDLAALLGERAKGVRFYQGLEPLSPGHWVAHLIAVGLDEKKVIIPKYYDYSNPCPPICE